MGGQARSLVMSVLQNDPTEKAVLWSDVYTSVHGEGQMYHMEQAKGNEANYLINACLVEHIESVEFPEALTYSIDIPIEKCIARAVCNRYGLQACSIIPAYGQVESHYDYFTALISISHNKYVQVPHQLLIICERRSEH